MLFRLTNPISYSWLHIVASASIYPKTVENFQHRSVPPLAAPMIGRSKTRDDPYHHTEEEVVDKQHYITAIGAFIYSTTYIRPDLGFTTSILARHSQNSKARHWNIVKHLMQYLRGTEDLGLQYRKAENRETTSFANSNFKTDGVAEKFQTGYIFIRDGASISWKLVKQTTIYISTNHDKLLAFYEATREVV
jgi:hypothetical protein